MSKIYAIKVGEIVQVLKMESKDAAIAYFNEHAHEWLSEEKSTAQLLECGVVAEATKGISVKVPKRRRRKKSE